MSQEIQVPSLLLNPKINEEYHAYSDDHFYHPTSMEGIKQEESNDVSTEEAIYTASIISKRTKKIRKPSQPDSILHALAPPSHILKARRLSKSNQDESPTGEMKRKRSMVTDYQKELVNHSAVSPRFMTLRKLSEVTALPSQTFSPLNNINQDVPPVPRLPSSHLTPASSPPPSVATLPNTNPVKRELDQDLLLPSGIDSIIEAQLQHHLGQLVWRVSESHVEACRFWDEQKEPGVWQKLDNLINAKKDTVTMKQELEWHQQQLAEKNCQLHELETLRIRNSELEKQHEIDVAIIKSQQLDKEKLENRLQKYEEEGKSTLNEKFQMRLYDLKAQNKQLKIHVARIEQVNRKLNQQVEEYKAKVEIKKEEKEENTLNLKRMSDSVSASNDKQKKQEHADVITWAEIMESEDEAKKAVEQWTKKYKDLEQTHKSVVLQLEKEQETNQNRLTEKDQEIRQLKQVENIHRAQLDCLQSELKKAQQQQTKPLKHCGCCRYHKQASPRASAREQSFIAQDGYLTFTAEINGRLSKYSVKIPKEQVHVSKRPSLNPNAPSWRQL
ncbi:hypothetical protein RO3G_16095 [Rhizopus delemar RA 99-880]|uniref:Uncharacterized protein n=1 Tax=Rhizopus delemar (strain RA 99-880 / ATCC MYA-4621 / FGSC 9543 / NRRL 43880) TaxID=246409 RepID=I1CSF4_RHIO9|nr:hypothetical protein RO3G_16095 [Rhizopus delemar RA 99-880]|eukprot:EIE91384.1 hypothetical protein RO3G_16095 [Rhizopus delemar RA 99-880]